jgi:hypothetical protein
MSTSISASDHTVEDKLSLYLWSSWLLNTLLRTLQSIAGDESRLEVEGKQSGSCVMHEQTGIMLSLIHAGRGIKLLISENGT